MAREKTYTKTAKIGNEDLRATFYYLDGSLRFRLHIAHDDDTVGGTGDVSVAASLTAGERTDLLAALVKLRDAGFVAAGYTEV